MPFIVSACIAVLLLVWVGIDNVTQTFVRFNGWYAIPAILLFLAGIALNALCVFLLVRTFNRVRWNDFIQPFIASWSVGSLFPSRAGDFSLALFHERLGLNRKQIAASVLVDKLITLSVIVVIGWIGLWWLFQQNQYLNQLLSITTILAIILIASIYWVAKKTTIPWIPSRWKKKLVEFGGELRYLFQQRNALVLNAVLTVARLILNGLGLVALFWGIGYPAPALPVVFSMAIATLGIFAPFTFSGTGVKESMFIFLLSTQGVPFAESAAAAILHWVFTYALVALGSLWSKPA